MATRLKRQLNDRQVKNAKPQPKTYRLLDGDGLFLEVTPSGSKIWRMRANLNKKEMILTFGNYPAVLLAQARKKCEQARSLISQGIDPREAKKAAEAAELARTDNTFEKIARDWHANRLTGWTKNTARDMIVRLERDVFPAIGKRPVAEVSHNEIISLLRTIEDRGAFEIAKRTKANLSRIFSYAIQVGVTDRNPAADLNDILKPTPKKHFNAIKPDELPSFLKAFDSNQARFFPATRIAFNLMMLLFMRTSELIEAEWTEIDLDKGIWIIPWHRMKMGRRKINPDMTDHRIDLPRQAVALLKELHQFTGHRKYLFPSQRSPGDKPMSNGAILMVLRRLGYQGKMTGHGFRTLAATALEEQGFRREVLDKLLAHKEQNKVKAAYFRPEFQKERKQILQAWADYIDTIRRRNAIRLVA